MGVFFGTLIFCVVIRLCGPLPRDVRELVRNFGVF